MKRLIISLFLISVFILSFLPVKDTDFGWHYRCGNQFLTSKKPCLTNQFSYLLPNYQAYNPTFLYDMTLAFVYNLFGFLGISTLGAVVFTLSAFFLIKVFTGPLWFRITAFYLIFWFSSSVFNLGLRSQIISYLFFTISLFLLEKKESKLQLIFLPIIFLIWVNSHLGFFLGPILVGFFAISRPHPKNWLIFFLSIFTTLLNPFGAKVYLEILRHFQAPLNTMIAEWVAPPIWHKILIISLASFILTLEVKSNSSNISLFNVLLILFFTFLSLKARRNLPFFYSVCFYILSKSKLLNKVFNNQFKELSKKTVTLREQFLLLSFLLSIIFTASVINIPQTFKFDQNWVNYCHQGLIDYPCQAVEKTNLKRLSGNLFTSYEWGGFLIWQTPKLRVFADGRMSAWQDKQGNYPYQIYLYIIQAREGWNRKLKNYKTDYLLIGNGTFLDLELQKNPFKYGWKETYRDKTAVFYQKITTRF